MAANVFISYSHRDEGVLERLRVHMRMLEREGSVDAWDDREIHAGDNVDETIAQAYDASTIFMPIVSPDFLASSYCYDKEMALALAKAEIGEVTIVPVIAEPCDWLASPLKKFKALPKDGKAIAEWTNPNNAYLSIIEELRRLTVGHSGRLGNPSVVASKESSLRSSASPRLKIQKDFSSIDRARFRDEAYQEIKRYFSASIEEFTQIEGLQGHFEETSANAFTCTIVNKAKRGAEGHLTVWVNKGTRHGFGDISCSFDAYAEGNAANEGVIVANDEYDQYLELGMFSRWNGDDLEKRLTALQVADILWRGVLERAGIEYEW